MPSHKALLHWAIFGCVCVSAARGADLAPVSLYEGKPIADIRFDPVQQPLLRADRTRILPFQPGEPLRAADVQTAIKKLYATGVYANIEVEAETTADGVVLVFHTAEQWFVGPVEVRGRPGSPPTSGQLANATRLQLGTPYDEGDVLSATEGMRDLLERNGLFRARIQSQVSRDAEHQNVILTFRVDAGRRARLTLPRIEGDTRIPAEDVARAAGYKSLFGLRWRPATASNTQRGVVNIRRKYQRLDRLTASVTLDGREYLASQNRLRPVITANGGPRIKFETEGAKVSRSSLKKYVPVFDQETVNHDLLVSGARNLRDYFQNKGYFDAEVDFTSKQPSADLRVITYKIGLGERHRIVRVDITGNRYFKTSELTDRMYIRKAGWIQLRQGRYSNSFAQHDVNAIQALYRDNGFRDVQVTVETTDDYQGKRGDVAVTIRIDEGPQYLVSELNVEGMERKDRDTIIALLGSQPGQPFAESTIGVDRRYLLELYQSEGYPDVLFEYSTAEAGPAQVAVTYKITPGAPRFVRDVLIYGMRRTRQRLVSPNILLQPGDPLSWTRMGTMQRRLYNLGVFDKVDMAVQNEQGDTENKYVLYQVTEGHLYNMAIGLGLEIAQFGGSRNSLNNPAGATGVSPRAAFELSRLNLWGLGHIVALNTRYSTLNQRASVTYTIPRFHEAIQNVTFLAFYDNIRDVLTYTGRRIEGSVQMSHKHSKATTFLWRYAWRDVTVNQSFLKINPELIPLVAQEAHIALIGGTMIQDRRDDPINAHRGFYNSVDLALISRVFGGNKNFTRLLARESYYHPVWRKDWILATNTMFGWIQPFGVPAGVSGFEYVPLPEHFFGGGSTSMRGFPDNQAGPRDPVTGFPLGGNALLMQQTELRFPLLGPNIGGVLFHDMGNVYTDVSSISFRVSQNGLKDFNYMVHAVGFGLRYRTIVGPVRVDLAYALNPPTFFGLEGTYNQLLFGGAVSRVQSVGHFHFFISIGQAF
jgi:outer membrane protein assembly complex protein YaeT